MSSKLTELTESSPSAPPPSVLHGSSILSIFSSPSMASSGHFDPTQTYDGYKAIFRMPLLLHWEEAIPLNWEASFKRQEVLVEQRNVARWTHAGGPIPVGGRPIYSSSEVSIPRINTEGIVKQIRQIADSPPDPDAEGSDELDGEEVKVIPHSAGYPPNSSPSQPPSKRFQSQVIPGTPRNFQPTLATIPTSILPVSPHSSHTRPALNPAVRPSPVQQSRNSPIVNSQKLQPVASTSRRRKELSPLPFPAAQVFQHRDHWPIRVNREDPNMASGNKDSVARLFRKVDRDSREVIMYANDRSIPGTAYGEMAAKFSWYEDQLIDDFQKTFDYLGRDN
ncbi:hypothetical protein O181_092169 [Austropuccinia psidii MF-1]|uniref:Uncharacterized protein n=1 Tax=Austropuccinia psidii MF-1 TaxID=1389203 RepID=A0A9Q3P8L1_9BASI|nr:hypothetical protein [Austropuccinia psidii MF-1]